MACFKGKVRGEIAITKVKFIFSSFIQLFIYFFSQSVCAASLSATEIKINDYITGQKTAQIQLLKKLVNINSGTMNVRGVHEVGETVRAELNRLGFKTRWVEEPKNMHRAGTLVATRRGSKGLRLLLIGHLDTVFSSEGKTRKFTMTETTAKGPGVIDDKGAIVVLLTALKSLNATHSMNDSTITIVLTGDEEDSGKPTSISRKPLFDAAYQSDVALDFESAITLNTATIARRGIALWTVEAKGNESHSATIFQKNVGDGAIFELSRILNAMRLQLEGETYLSFNPGIMLGGTKVEHNLKTSTGTVFGKENVVSKVAYASGDLRFVNSEQKQKTENKMSAIVKDFLPGTSSIIAFQDGIPAMPPTPENLKLLEKYSEVSVDLGEGVIKPLDPGLRGAGDISHIASIVPAKLAGLGPLGLGSHSVIESVELASIPIQTRRAAILIYRLTHAV